MIDDSRARKLSNDLKRSTYYETCSTYGLNVERVFQDGETERLLLLVLISAETKGLAVSRARFRGLFSTVSGASFRGLFQGLFLEASFRGLFQGLVSGA